MFFFPDTLQESMKYQTRFISQKPAKVVLSSMEVVAQSMGFKTHIRNYKVLCLSFFVVYCFTTLHSAHPFCFVDLDSFVILFT